MPFEWNNILVVDKDELVPAFYKSEGSLKLEISRYNAKDYGIKKIRKGGNGRQMLVAYDSLRADIQEALGDPRKISNSLERFYQTDKAAVHYYTKVFQFEDGSRLSLTQQEQYIVNASVLAACVRLQKARELERRSKGGSCKGMMASICRDVAAFGTILVAKYRTAAPSLPTTERRFKDAYKAFVKDGEYDYAGLIDGRAKNQNRRLMTTDMLSLLNGLFATQTHKPTRTEVSRQYEAFLNGYVEVVDTESGEVFSPSDFKPITDGVIVHYLGQWYDKIGTGLARSGDRQQYMGQFLPYHSLSLPEYAGEIMSIDDRQPPFEYSKGERVWLYMGIDIGSQAWTVMVHGKSKEGIIVDFYRQLLRNYTQWGFRLPAELECESSLNSMFKNTFLRPGALFDHVRIEANNARGKYIERMFGKLRYEKEKSKAGWIGRPFAKKEDNQKGSVPVPIVPYDQIIQNSLRDIEDWNNSPHPKHEEMTRWEVFTSKQHPALSDTNWEAILPHLGYKTQTSCKAGIIQLNNHEHLIADKGVVLTGRPLIEKMKHVEGQALDIYWLDGNDGQVLHAVVFLRGGEVQICEAMAKPTYSRSVIGRTADQEKGRKLMSAYANTIEAFGREQKNNLTAVQVIDHREPAANRKFVMPGLKRYDPSTPSSGSVRHHPEGSEGMRETETEILQERNMEEMEAVPVGGNTIYDRF